MDWKLERMAVSKIRTDEDMLWESIMTKLAKDMKWNRKIRHQKSTEEFDTGKTPYSRFKSYIVKKIRSQMHVVSSPKDTRWQQHQTNDGSFVEQLPLDLSSESSEDSQPTIQKLDNIVSAQAKEEAAFNRSQHQQKVARLVQQALMSNRPPDTLEAEKRRVIKNKKRKNTKEDRRLKKTEKIRCQNPLHGQTSEKNIPDSLPMGTMKICEIPICSIKECQKTSFKPYISSDNISCGIHLHLEKKIHVYGLKDDYYLNILDWNYQNLLAIGLGSAGTVWNGNSHTLVENIDMNSDSKFVSAVAWIKDRNCLAIGTCDGEVQIWDIEYKKRLRNMLGHMSVVGALTWNNYIVSSGSVLGYVHHHDVRIAEHHVGTINQTSSICAIKWSSDGRCIAAGSSNGLLNLWPNDPGLTMHSKPLCTMAHPTAVKAMNWCPWQANILATGGGMRDGVLRIWDTNTGECIKSASTNSQVCSLEWMPQMKCILTGQGLPANQMSIWKYPSLMRATDVYGHSGRILHLAMSPDHSRICSAAADGTACIWNCMSTAEGK